MYFKLEQSLNTPPSNFSSLSGRITEVRLSQLLKASYLISFRLVLGNVISLRFVQWEKAFDLIIYKPSLNLTDFKFLQP